MTKMEKIKKKNIEDILALSPMQKGMLFHYLKDPESNNYWEQLNLDISGEIDIRYFEQAWNIVGETNEMLRTVFRWRKVKEPVQVVLRKYNTKLRYYDISGKDSKNSEKWAEETAIRDREEKFELSDVPFRITLCKIEEYKYKLIISNHHILYDGWSNGLILKEFLEAYDELCKGNTLIPSVKKKTRFKEFLKCIRNQDIKKQEKYWKHSLNGLDTQTELSVKKRKGKKITSTGNFRARFADEMKAELENFIKKHRITLASFLYSAWGLLLQKYNNSDDVIFGTTVSGRSAKIKGIEDMVGLFINTLPLRVQTHPNEKSIDLILRIKEVLEQREEYEHTSLVTIKEYSELDNNEELFDVIMVIENYPLDRRAIQRSTKLSVHSSPIIEATHYDLSVGIIISEEVEINFYYNKNCFDEEIIRNIANHFTCILHELLKDSGRKIFEIDMLSEEEKKQVLFDFNNTEEGYPEDKAIQRLFEEQVEKTPDNTAVVETERNSHISYRELNEKASQLKRVLRRKGVKPGSITAIMVEHSFEMLSGVFGILKAGGAYLPLDSESPEERIEYILNNSGAALLFTQHSKTDWSGFNREVIFVEDEYLYTTGKIKPGNANKPDDLIYVIYTSGSTGKPKGVAIEHRGVVNYIKWAEKIYLQNHKYDFPLYSSLSFDLTVTSVYLPLISGNKIFIYKKDRNNTTISRIFREDKVQVIKLTPTHLKMIKDVSAVSSSIKKLIVGGEELTTALANEIYEKFNKKIEIYNEYGPTETVVGCTIYKFNPGKDKGNYVPIGIPFNNTQIYILDRRQNPLPVGIPGEIYVSGEGVSRGYVSDPELTRNKFGKNPFVRGSRLYRTGDLAKWNFDGNIEFLGRIDHQVKVRGFRIELGEIEAQLLNHDEIKEAVVIKKETNKGNHYGVERDSYLCAYIVSNSIDTSDNTALISAELKAYLSHSIPEYMIPSYFKQLKKMPLTPSGKVDRKGLPDPEVEPHGDYAAPTNETEEIVTEIWSEVLGIEKNNISIDADFFESGGHSLKATIISTKIHKKLNVKLPLDEIFRIPTIRNLSKYIESALKARYTSIQPIEKKDYYPLSSAQERMYFIQQMQTNTTTYNMPLIINLNGAIDKKRLEKIFRKLVRRHASFRTSFEQVSNKPVQRVHDEVEFALTYHDFPSQETETRKDDLEIVTNNFVKPFDLSRAPLLRVGLVNAAEGRHILMIDKHHIISDGASLEILRKDFMSLYSGNSLEPMRLQYKDFSRWQNHTVEAGKIQHQENYWLNLYSNEIPKLNLPMDYTRPASFRSRGDTYYLKLDEECTAQFKRLGFHNDVTLYMNLLAVFNILLHKYTGQDDIVIGTAIAGRPHADLQDIIGMFVNMLAMRNQPGEEKTYLEFLKKVKETTIKAFDNQDVPFDDLIEKLNLARDPSRNPLFDVVVGVQNFKHIVNMPEEVADELTDLKQVSYEHQNKYKNKTCKFDLDIDMYEVDNEIHFILQYYVEIFTQDTIERFMRHLLRILKQVSQKPDIRISDISLLTEEEKRELIHDFNSKTLFYPEDKTFHELYEAQVEKTPDNIAVTYGFEYITYRQLEENANQLANYLYLDKKIRPEDRVGILMNRSINCILALLGILKAGGAYVPIDPVLPPERIIYIINDAAIGVVVSQETNSKLLNTLQWECGTLHTFICMESTRAYSRGHDSTILETYSKEKVSSIVKTKPQCLAYVIYTSGTTGKPKGVMIQHNHLVNVSMGWEMEYHLKEIEINLLQMANFTFDVFSGDLSRAFLNGGKLVLCPDDVRVDPPALYDLILKHKITLLESFPSLVIPFMQYVHKNKLSIDNLQLLIIGSDVCHVRDFKQMVSIFGKKMRIINSYGLTESTIDASYYEEKLENIPAVENVPIGKPLPNMNFYILSPGRKLVPIGITGELYIGGESIARGYMNRSQLTHERFLPDPFNPGARIYKTGDCARWRPDGNVEFLGRFDHQVKMNGIRVELGEIESQLSKHNDIEEAVVVSRKANPGGVHGNEREDNFITAYFVSKKKLEISELREYLLKKLPYYMIPLYFVQVDKMPLNANGKVARKMLPSPECNTGNDYVAPGNQPEEKLTSIWSDILGIDLSEIGVNANFFELGGHSLKVAVLVSRIHRELNVKMLLRDVFRLPTIRGLAEHINRASKNNCSSIEPVEIKEYYPLSPAQKRLYILQQMDPDSTAYNMWDVLVLEGELQKEVLEQSFKKLIKRCESFRTSFELVEDKPEQRIHHKINFEIEYYNMSEVNVNVDNRVREKIHQFVRPFDLSHAPLLRLGLIKEVESRHILMIDMHHIISDGTSIKIFIKEFMDFYTGKELRALKIQYKEYSEWQNHLLTSGEKEKQEKYWLKQFEGEIPVLNLPIDYDSPRVKNADGSRIHFHLDTKKTRALKELALKEDATLFMVLLAVFYILLAKLTGQVDIVIGIPTSGRRHVDLENLIGMFLNTLALRNRPEGEKTFKEFLEEIRQKTLEAFENQDYPFEELVGNVMKKRDIGQNPLFNSMFIFQNMDKTEIQIQGLKISPYQYEGNTSLFNLTLIGEEREGNLVFSLEYSIHLFKKETVEQMSQYYDQIVDVIITNEDIRIDDIKLKDAIRILEKASLDVQFNI